MIRDRNIAWQRKSRIITAGEMIAGGFADASGTAQGFGTGAPPLTELSNFGFGTIAVTNTDVVTFLDFITPREMEIAEEIGVRVIWATTGAVTGSDSVTFTVVYDQVDPGEAIIEPATALDTTIAAQTAGTTTAYLLKRTARGIISKKKFDETARTGMLSWKITTALTGFSAAEVGILGLEIDYLPRLTWSNGEEFGNLNKNLAAQA
tara:strand:- start:5599 stop:6219 length:621 start_codon:yes stop_codon:yes gene_type:complete